MEELSKGKDSVLCKDKVESFNVVLNKSQTFKMHLKLQPKKKRLQLDFDSTRTIAKNVIANNKEMEQPKRQTVPKQINNPKTNIVNKNKMLISGVNKPKTTGRSLLNLKPPLNAVKIGSRNVVKNVTKNPIIPRNEEHNVEKVSKSSVKDLHPLKTQIVNDKLEIVDKILSLVNEMKTSDEESVVTKDSSHSDDTNVRQQNMKAEAFDDVAIPKSSQNLKDGKPDHITHKNNSEFDQKKVKNELKNINENDNARKSSTFKSNVDLNSQKTFPEKVKTDKVTLNNKSHSTENASNRKNFHRQNDMKIINKNTEIENGKTESTKTEKDLPANKNKSKNFKEHDEENILYKSGETFLDNDSRENTTLIENTVVKSKINSPSPAKNVFKNIKNSKHEIDLVLPDNNKNTEELKSPGHERRESEDNVPLINQISNANLSTDVNKKPVQQDELEDKNILISDQSNENVKPESPTKTQSDYITLKRSKGSIFEEKSEKNSEVKNIQNQSIHHEQETKPIEVITPEIQEEFMDSTENKTKTLTSGEQLIKPLKQNEQKIETSQEDEIIDQSQPKIKSKDSFSKEQEIPPSNNNVEKINSRTENFVNSENLIDLTNSIENVSHINSDNFINKNKKPNETLKDLSRKTELNDDLPSLEYNVRNSNEQINSEENLLKNIKSNKILPKINDNFSTEKEKNETVKQVSQSSDSNETYLSQHNFIDEEQQNNTVKELPQNTKLNQNIPEIKLETNSDKEQKNKIGTNLSQVSESDENNPAENNSEPNKIFSNEQQQRESDANINNVSDTDIEPYENFIDAEEQIESEKNLKRNSESIKNAPEINSENKEKFINHEEQNESGTNSLQNTELNKNKPEIKSEYIDNIIEDEEQKEIKENADTNVSNIKSDFNENFVPEIYTTKSLSVSTVPVVKVEQNEELSEVNLHDNVIPNEVKNSRNNLKESTSDEIKSLKSIPTYQLEPERKNSGKDKTETRLYDDNNKRDSIQNNAGIITNPAQEEAVDQYNSDQSDNIISRCIQNDIISSSDDSEITNAVYDDKIADTEEYFDAREEIIISDGSSDESLDNTINPINDMQLNDTTKIIEYNEEILGPIYVHDKAEDIQTAVLADRVESETIDIIFDDEVNLIQNTENEGITDQQDKSLDSTLDNENFKSIDDDVTALEETYHDEKVFETEQDETSSSNSDTSIFYDANDYYDKNISLMMDTPEEYVEVDTQSNDTIYLDNFDQIDNKTVTVLSDDDYLEDKNKILDNEMMAIDSIEENENKDNIPTVDLHKKQEIIEAEISDDMRVSKEKRISIFGPQDNRMITEIRADDTMVIEQVLPSLNDEISSSTLPWTIFMIICRYGLQFVFVTALLSYYYFLACVAYQKQIILLCVIMLRIAWEIILEKDKKDPNLNFFLTLNVAWFLIALYIKLLVSMKGYLFVPLFNSYNFVMNT